MKTESEIAVEEFFATRGVHIEKIDEGAERSPDYRLDVDGMEIVAEVKQFNSTREEERKLSELKEGEVLVLDADPGKGVRKKISDGAAQLKNLAKGKLPGILILFNNRPFLLGNPASPYHVRVGMYGYETIVLAKTQESGDLALRDRRFGGSKKVTEQHNTTISAIGVMELRSGGVSFKLYHNQYAAIPVPVGLFVQLGIGEFVLSEREPGKFQEWVGTNGS